MRAPGRPLLLLISVRAPSTASVLDGLRERLGERVVTAPADASPTRAAALARDADVAVRASLTAPPNLVARRVDGRCGGLGRFDGIGAHLGLRSVW